MFYTIYSVYIDSVNFLRNNLTVVGLFLFLSLVDFLLERYLVLNTATIRFFQVIIPFIIYASIEVYATVLIYKKEVAINSSDSVWAIYKKAYERAVLLLISNSILLLLYFLLVNILFHKVEIIINLLNDIGFFIYFVSCILGFKHLVFYNNNSILISVKAGIEGYFKNFTFYTLVFLLSILLFIFLYWLTSLKFHALENFSTSNQSRVIDWLRMIIYYMLSAVQSVVFSYAFLSKNRSVIYEI